VLHNWPALVEYYKTQDVTFGERLQSFEWISRTVLVFDLLRAVGKFSLFVQTVGACAGEVPGMLCCLRVTLEEILAGRTSTLSSLLALDGGKWNGISLQVQQPDIDRACAERTHVIGNVQQFLEERFQPHVVFTTMACVFPWHWPSVPDALPQFGNQQVLQLAEMFGGLLQLESMTLLQEWVSVKVHLAQRCTLGTANRETLLGLVTTYLINVPTFSQIWDLVLTLAASSASNERLFSARERQQGYLRRHLTAKHLEQMLQININGPALHKWDPAPAVRMFLLKRQRKQHGQGRGKNKPIFGPQPKPPQQFCDMIAQQLAADQSKLQTQWKAFLSQSKSGKKPTGTKRKVPVKEAETEANVPTRSIGTDALQTEQPSGTSDSSHQIGQPLGQFLESMQDWSESEHDSDSSSSRTSDSSSSSSSSEDDDFEEHNQRPAKRAKSMR
jgi:hypothetical protein